MHIIKNRIGIGLILLFLIFNFHSEAQKKSFGVSSMEMIKQGMALSDSSKYDEAVALFQQVSRNDTNYPLALFEEAICYVSNDKDSLALDICNKGLELHSEYQPDFYKFKASALIDLNKYDDAISLIKSAISLYPNVYLLHFTEGLAYYKAQRYDSAIACFERSINLNAFHASSHYYLGKCCLEQGRIIPAVLSLQFCLVLEPLTTRSFGLVQLLEKVMENKYEVNKANKVSPSKYNDGAFSDIESLVQSQAALNKGYKAKSKINYNVIKQCQLVYDKLTYTSNTNNFWMETYVPFFIDMRDHDYFEPYAYYIMQSVNDDQIQKEIKKEKKKISEFVDWADKKITETRKTRTIIINGQKTPVKCYYYSNHLIEAMGPTNSRGVETGEWTFYDETTGRIIAKGLLDDNGNRTGVWNWYYIDSVPKERTNFVAGKKEGLSETWYENGAPKEKCSYKNDSLSGEAWDYNSSGIVTAHGTYKSGELTGPYTLNYADGKPQYQLTYDKSGVDGEQKGYYVNGQQEFSIMYASNKKNGTAIEYRDNGKIKDQGEYIEGAANGHWKFYDINGNLEKECDYVKGKLTGISYNYYPNGKKKSEIHYDKDGMLDGPYTEYDDDGIMYVQYDYKKDAAIHYKYVDKTGKVLSEASLADKKIHFKNYSPSGILQSEGDYLNNHRNGEWKFYTTTGALSIADNYYDGMLNGLTIEYYTNGKVKDSINYINDQMNGYYVSYSLSGNMKSEGWYTAGQAQGDWYYYDNRGNISSHFYYLDGETHGYVDFYNATGRLDEEDFYHPGYFDKAMVYDTLGKNVIYTYASDKGNGHYQLKYNNGQIMLDRTYVAGNEEGTQTFHYYDGKLWAQGDYLLGKKQGEYKYYFNNGNLQSDFTYNEGNKTGPSSTYFESGKIRNRSNYIDDEQEGPIKIYYENGNLSMEGQSKDGMYEGDFKSYSPDSLLYCIRRYHKDIITAYSYPDKDNNPVPFIPVEKGTGNVKTFFSNGNKSLECTYVNGAFQGKRTVYFSNGQVFEDENYESGKLTGAQKYYYPNGKLKAEENYFMGDRDGVSSYYYNDGKLEHQETWVLDDKQGHFRYYDHNGNLLRTVLYYNDHEVSESNP